MKPDADARAGDGRVVKGIIEAMDEQQDLVPGGSGGGAFDVGEGARGGHTGHAVQRDIHIIQVGTVALPAAGAHEQLTIAHLPRADTTEPRPERGVGQGLTVGGVVEDGTPPILGGQRRGPLTGGRDDRLRGLFRTGGEQQDEN